MGILWRRAKRNSEVPREDNLLLFWRPERVEPPGVGGKGSSSRSGRGSGRLEREFLELLHQSGDCNPGLKLAATKVVGEQGPIKLRMLRE